MSIEELKALLNQAMKDRDDLRVRTIRSVISAFQKKEIEMRTSKKEMEGDELMTVIAKQAKMRKESLAMYLEADRKDLAKTEEEELAILSSFLPESLSDDQIIETVKEVISSTGAETLKDMGRVMGAAMAKLKGQADGSDVQRIVKDLLSH